MERRNKKWVKFIVIIYFIYKKYILQLPGHQIRLMWGCWFMTSGPLSFHGAKPGRGCGQIDIQSRGRVQPETLPLPPGVLCLPRPPLWAAVTHTQLSWWVMCPSQSWQLLGWDGGRCSPRSSFPARLKEGMVTCWHPACVFPSWKRHLQHGHAPNGPG